MRHSVFFTHLAKKAGFVDVLEAIPLKSPKTDRMIRAAKKLLGPDVEEVEEPEPPEVEELEEAIEEMEGDELNSPPSQ